MSEAFPMEKRPGCEGKIPSLMMRNSCYPSAHLHTQPRESLPAFCGHLHCSGQCSFQPRALTGSNTHFKSAFKQLFIQGRPTQKGSNWAAKKFAARDVMKEVRRDPVGGWLSKRPGSVWMFKSLSEKSSRAQVQSGWRHNPLVANWTLTWTNQATIPDSRRGKGEGELVPAFFVKNFHVILFLLKKWESFSHPTPTQRPSLFFSTREPDPGSQKAAGQRRLSLTSITSVAVGQAQLNWREKPIQFCWTSFTHSLIPPRQPTPTCKEENAQKSGFPVSFVALLAAERSCVSGWKSPFSFTSQSCTLQLRVRETLYDLI